MPDAVDMLLSGPEPPKEVPKPEAAPSVDAVDMLLGGGTPEAAPAPAAPEGGEPGLVSRVGSTVADTVSGVIDYARGDSRREFDYPAFTDVSKGLSEKQKAAIAAGYVVATDDKAVADIIKKQVPGAEIGKDKFGNPTVNLNGRNYYVNVPGLDMDDVTRFVGQAVQYAPSGKVSGGVARSMLRSGVMAGGTSIGQDLVAGELGSEQGVDAEKALMAGGGAALFQGLTPLAVKAWRAIFGSPKYVQNGQLTDLGRRAARAAGLDPDDITDDAAVVFSKEARDAASPNAAGGAAMSKEFDIPYTRGQATGSFKRLAREEATRHGALGDDSGQIMREFDKLQQERIVAASGRVQGRLSGGETQIAKPTQAGSAIVSGTKQKAEQLSQKIDDAYAAYRGANDARFTGDSLKELSRSIKETLTDFPVEPDLMPATIKGIKNLAELGGKRGGGKITAVTLRAIEQKRRTLNILVDAAKNKTDRTGVLKVKAALDDWLDDAVDNALFSGDDESLALLKQARGLRRQYGELFQPRNSSDAAGKAIQKILQEDPTPEEAVSYLFGRSKLGAKLTAAKTADRLKNILGEGSEEWNAVREMGWLKLTQDAAGKAKTPAGFIKALDETFQQNESLMKSLYSSGEIAQFRRFKNALARTITPEEAKNPSKTAFTLGRLMRDMTRRTGTMFTFSGQPGLGAAFFTAARVPGIMGTRGAREAVRALPAPRPAAPAFVGVGGASGATAGAD